MATVKLSEKKSEMLRIIKTELEIPSSQRAVALKLAFAKGIDSERTIDLNIRNGRGIDFPTSVITRTNETLIKHLIINKLGKNIEEHRLHFLILSIIQNGIEEMYEEIQNLATADSYILFLLNKHEISTL